VLGVGTSKFACYRRRNVSAGLIFTDHSAYGVSVTARSLPTAVSRNVAVPGAVETPAFGGAALGVEGKVADQPQEIQAVSVTVCHLEIPGTLARCREKLNGFIIDEGGQPCR
jgi:hypothetical protein